MERPSANNDSMKSSSKHGKRKASQGGGPVSHDASRQTSRTNGTLAASNPSGGNPLPASNGNPCFLHVSNVPLFPGTILNGSLSLNGSMVAARVPPAAAVATASPWLAPTYHHSIVGSAPNTAQDAIASLRLRQDLHRLEQEQGILALMNWDNGNSPNLYGRHAVTAEPGLVGALPWTVPAHNTASMLSPGRGLLPGEYYHSGAPAAILLGSDPLTSALLASEMHQQQHQRREMDALLWHRQVDVATSTMVVPQHSLTALRALDQRWQDPNFAYLSGSAGHAAAAQRGAAPPTLAPWEGGTVAASAAAMPGTGPLGALSSITGHLPIASSSYSNGTAHDAAASASRTAFGAGHGPNPSSRSSSSSASSGSVPETSIVGTKGEPRRFSGVVHEADASTASGDGTSSGRVVPMARETDAVHSSRYQCLLREQIEYFEADDRALRAKAQGRNLPIQLRQVGIRCVHCARRRRRTATSAREGVVYDVGRDDAGRMVRGAVYYPTKLSHLYQAVQNMANNHFVNRTCPSAPSSLLDEIQEARRLRPKRSGGRGKRYFGQSAERAGVVDAPDDSGLFFAAAGSSTGSTAEAVAATSSAARPS